MSATSKTRSSSPGTTLKMGNFSGMRVPMITRRVRSHQMAWPTHMVDANESRVQGATVEIVYSSFRPPTLWRTRLTTISDDKGEFLLRYVEPGEELRLEVAYPGFRMLRSASMSLAQGEIRSELTLVLPAAH